jgi:hypothetical protein
MYSRDRRLPAIRSFGARFQQLSPLDSKAQLCSNESMPVSASAQRSALQWIGWAASFLIVLALTLPWTLWVLNSPMAAFSNKFNGHVFFSPDGPEDRFQYFQNLLIAPGDRINYATCVLCSITVLGIVNRQVTALWGDVTVGEGGSVGQGIQVTGGRLTLMTGAGVNPPPLSATGGSVLIEPGVKTYPAFAISHPRIFYPGQRSWPDRGVALFVLFVLSASACAGWLLSGPVRERVENALRRPFRSALFGILLFALVWPLLYLTVLSLYIFPPLSFLLYLSIPTVFWLALAMGFAVMAEWIGSLLVRQNRLASRLTGAAILMASMVIPVLGLFVLLAVMVVAPGVGIAVLPWQQLVFRRRSS